MRSAFPDLRYEIREVLVGGGDLVAVRLEVSGTHRGFRVLQINLERSRGGRIADHWRVTDEASLAWQLGLAGAARGGASPGTRS